MNDKFRAATPNEIWEERCEQVALIALGYLASVVRHIESACSETEPCSLATVGIQYFDHEVNELKKVRSLGAAEYYRMNYESFTFVQGVR
jgi:hypothetical protein